MTRSQQKMVEQNLATRGIETEAPFKACKTATRHLSTDEVTLCSVHGMAGSQAHKSYKSTLPQPSGVWPQVHGHASQIMSGWASVDDIPLLSTTAACPEDSLMVWIVPCLDMRKLLLGSCSWSQGKPHWPPALAGQRAGVSSCRWFWSWTLLQTAQNSTESSRFCSYKQMSEAKCNMHPVVD